MWWAVAFVSERGRWWGGGYATTDTRAPESASDPCGARRSSSVMLEPMPKGVPRSTITPSEKFPTATARLRGCLLGWACEDGTVLRLKAREARRGVSDESMGVRQSVATAHECSHATLDCYQLAARRLRPLSHKRTGTPRACTPSSASRSIVRRANCGSCDMAQTGIVVMHRPRTSTTPYGVGVVKRAYPPVDRPLVRLMHPGQCFDH